MNQLQGIDSTVTERSDSQLILRFLYAVGCRVFDSLLTFYTQFVNYADTLQYLHMVSVFTIEILLVRYRYLWRILPTQQELRYRLFHEQLLNKTTVSAFVHKLVAFRSALIGYPGLVEHVKETIDKMLKELEKQFVRFRVPDDRVSTAQRAELQQVTVKLMFVAWGLLHDSSISELSVTA